MGNIDWNHPASWEDVCRRHAARLRWNAVRRLVAEGRRGEVLALLARLAGRSPTPPTHRPRQR